MAKPECSVHHLGLTEYNRAWELQKQLALRVAEGSRPMSLLLTEHPSVYTMGRRGSREQVLLDDAQLSEAGVPLHQVDRGGQVTYHGPGQLVAYPIVDLHAWEGGPVKYVRALEQVIIKTLADLGLASGTVDGLTGVWAGERKIAAIGVRVSRGITYHGLALNVNTDLSWFRHIIPCGIDDVEVTSVEAFLGKQVDLGIVAYGLTYHFGNEMGFHMVEADSLPEGLETAPVLSI